MANPTVAQIVAAACAARGVRRAFGVPGGGSCLDLIEAFDQQGIAFHLCRTETGAALMAAADAEARNGLGVALATQGPGAASAMNGLAHAALDRAPVLFISDGWTAQQTRIDSHQVFDQHAMSAPVVKCALRMEGQDPAGELEQALATMLAPPWGPVHLVLTGANARRQVATPTGASGGAAPAQEGAPPGRALDLLAAAKRPVLLLGLEVRDTGAARAVAAMAERLQCPVYTTYKAKGHVSDESPWVVGHVTGGAAEGPGIGAADLIIMCGLDPVELIGKPWPYSAPVLDVALVPHPVHYVQPTAAVYGPLASSLQALLGACRPGEWQPGEIAALREAMYQRLAYGPVGHGVSPQSVVELAMQAADDVAGGIRPSISVDAGAHMFSAMAFWKAREGGSALISNGLATMGFALPAGLARALQSPGTTTIAFTGDGGLMMCAGELATAAQCRARLCVIVFNDSALSLIALKQKSRGMAEAGVTWERADFASVARGFGLQAFTAHDTASYVQALRAALAADGPCLIDVHVDPSGYRAQSQALRG